MATYRPARLMRNGIEMETFAARVTRVKEFISKLQQQMTFDKKEQSYMLQAPLQTKGGNKQEQQQSARTPLTGLVGHLKRVAMPDPEPIARPKPSGAARIFRNNRLLSSTSTGKRIDREVKASIMRNATSLRDSPLKKAKAKTNHRWTTAYMTDCEKMNLTLIASQIPVWSAGKRVGTELDDLAMCPDGRLVCIERKSGYTAALSSESNRRYSNVSIHTTFPAPMSVTLPNSEYALHQLQAASGAQLWNNLVTSMHTDATTINELKISQSCVVYVTGRSASPWGDPNQTTAQNPFHGQRLFSKTNKRSMVAETKVKCSWAWTPSSVSQAARLLFP
jgi:hypothetical protein